MNSIYCVLFVQTPIPPLEEVSKPRYTLAVVGCRVAGFCARQSLTCSRFTPIEPHDVCIFPCVDDICPLSGVMVSPDISSDAAIVVFPFVHLLVIAGGLDILTLVLLIASVIELKFVLHWTVWPIHLIII